MRRTEDTIRQREVVSRTAQKRAPMYGSRLKRLLFLYTAYGNFAAIKIYEDFGFQITEVADYKIQGEIIQIVKMQQIGS
jgi:ribosomal protein S18 acetylase RimI-like enzyme